MDPLVLGLQLVVFCYILESRNVIGGPEWLKLGFWIRTEESFVSEFLFEFNEDTVSSMTYDCFVVSLLFSLFLILYFNGKVQ